MRFLQFAIVYFMFIELSLAGTPARNADNPGFRCVNRMPTTSFILAIEGDEAVLTTIHHNGVQFMPIHDGVIVPNDLSYLNAKSTLLTKMGERNSFRFPLKNCRVYSSGLVNCFGGNRQTFAGTEMEALRVFTSRIRQESRGQMRETFKVTLEVHVLGFSPVQELSISYDDSECRFEASKN